MRKFIALLVIAGAAGGCVSKPKHTVTLSDTADISSEIATAEREIAGLRAEQADVLATKSYGKAKKNLDDAKDLRAKDKANAKILDRVELARGFAADARAEVAAVKPDLQSVAENRAAAVKAAKDRTSEKNLARTDGWLSDLANDLRAGDRKKLAERVDLLNRAYLDEEADAAVADKLGAAKNDLETAKKEGAARWAPTTLREAELQLDQAEKAVRGSPRETSIVGPAAEKATAAAAKLLAVTRASKSMRYTSSEETVLKDMERREALRSQSAATAAALEASGRTLAATERERMDAEARAAEAAAAAKAAEDEAARAQAQAEEAMKAGENTLEAKADEIRKNFDKNEAEVFTTEDSILIRLRGLQFATNQALLTPAQYPILAKVRKSLEAVEPAEVTIAGHTDATGSKTKNMELSEKRAEAVKSFLVANEAVAENKVGTVGYGYEQPLATNKTAEGRAANRRIDITIKTE